ncbi:Major facilitator super domain-containing protein 7 [Globomyces sp. JEL0801]|nr:Major facilitator super domain-containing protein 7 [Globomyces sp. JEL0801]
MNISSGVQILVPQTSDRSSDTALEAQNMSGQTKYILYKQRFIIAFAVAMGNLANAALWSSYGAVTPVASKYFDTSSIGVNVLAGLFMVWYIPISPLSSWVIEANGVRLSVFIGFMLTIVGSLCRTLSNFLSVGRARFILCIVGQSIAAIGQPFLLDAPAKISSVWFGPNERTVANSVMALAQPIGSVIAFIISSSTITDESSSFLQMDVILLIISILGFIPCYWVENQPKTPSSHSGEIKSMGFKESLNSLLSNVQFLYLCIICGCSIGMFNTFITLISEYITPFGYSQADSGTLGSIVIGVGLLSAAVIGIYLDRSKNHELMIKFCSLMLLIGTIVFYMGAKPDNFIMLALGSAILGLGGFPVIPMAMELAVETTFPVDEGTSSGNYSVLKINRRIPNDVWNVGWDYILGHLKYSTTNWKFQ